MEVLVLWLFFAMLVGALGSSFGRSGFGWFLLSLVLSPVIGVIALLIAGKRESDSAPRRRDVMTCPECREEVLRDARVCRHCGHRFLPPETPQEVEARERYERNTLIKRRFIGFGLIALIVYIGYANN